MFLKATFIRLSVTLVGIGLTASVAAQKNGLPEFPKMVLSSSAFADGETIPAKYTQTVADPVSPPLQWSDPPPGALSYVLVMSDYDTASWRSSPGNLHWMLFNIPATGPTALPEALPAQQVLPDGTIQGRNLRKFVGYRGPGAPADGAVHHYVFELLALDTLLEIGPEATRAELFAAVEGHVLAKAALVGRFRRQAGVKP